MDLLYVDLQRFNVREIYFSTFLFNLFNPLPDNKILEWSELKQIADDILKVHVKWKISTI